MNRRVFIKNITLGMIATGLFSATSYSALTSKPADNKINSTEKQSGILNIIDMGAHSNLEKGYEKFDNRGIIQKAIDLCSQHYLSTGNKWTVYIPNGVFLATITLFYHEDTKKLYGICCLEMKSGVILKGEGTIKVADRQYGPGAFFRILASQRNINRLHDCQISDLVLDGNKDNQIKNIQASNIILECSSNVIISNIKSLNANGNGIQIRGGNSPAVQLSVINNYIDNCSYIGIQVSQFSDLKITGNHVKGCDNNGIDIYGDLGNGSYPKTNGNNFEIKNNIVENCLNGIFLETVSDGTVINNKLTNIKDGCVHINRIHGLPSNVNIISNEMNDAQYGFRATGDMHNIGVSDNKMYNIHSSFVSLGGGQGNCSNIDFENNYFNRDDQKIPIARFAGKIISAIKFNNNSIIISKGSLLNNNLVISTAERVTNSVTYQNWVVVNTAQ